MDRTSMNKENAICKLRKIEFDLGTFMHKLTVFESMGIVIHIDTERLIQTMEHGIHVPIVREFFN